MELIRSYLTKNPCYQANVQQADSRYSTFQSRGPLALMLHSVGCSQPDATVFINRWNKESYDYACVHAFIDANNGKVYQTLPWNFRGWHAGGSANNTHVGVEMCESSHIKYRTDKPWLFEVLDLDKAQADARIAYRSAVELFAMLCEMYSLDPLTSIISHNEGGKLGIASGHVDPEHYWSGLGLEYSMDGFRLDVANHELPFVDVPADAWYHNDLSLCVREGLIKGRDPTHFEPEANMTRAELVTVMARLIRRYHK